MQEIDPATGAQYEFEAADKRVKEEREAKNNPQPKNALQTKYEEKKNKGKGIAKPKKEKLTDDPRLAQVTAIQNAKKDRLPVKPGAEKDITHDKEMLGVGKVNPEPKGEKIFDDVEVDIPGAGKKTKAVPKSSEEMVNADTRYDNSNLVRHDPAEGWFPEGTSKEEKAKTRNQATQEAIEKFRKNNGREPTMDEIKSMYAKAGNLGVDSAKASVEDVTIPEAVRTRTAPQGVQTEWDEYIGKLKENKVSRDQRLQDVLGDQIKGLNEMHTENTDVHPARGIEVTGPDGKPMIVPMGDASKVLSSELFGVESRHASGSEGSKKTRADYMSGQTARKAPIDEAKAYMHAVKDPTDAESIRVNTVKNMLKLLSGSSLPQTDEEVESAKKLDYDRRAIMDEEEHADSQAEATGTDPKYSQAVIEDKARSPEQRQARASERDTEAVKVDTDPVARDRNTNRLSLKQMAYMKGNTMEQKENVEDIAAVLRDIISKALEESNYADHAPALTDILSKALKNDLTAKSEELMKAQKEKQISEFMKGQDDFADGVIHILESFNARMSKIEKAINIEIDAEKANSTFNVGQTKAFMSGKGAKAGADADDTDAPKNPLGEKTESANTDKMTIKEEPGVLRPNQDLKRTNEKEGINKKALAKGFEAGLKIGEMDAMKKMADEQGMIAGKPKAVSIEERSVLQKEFAKSAVITDEELLNCSGVGQLLRKKTRGV